MRIISDEQVKSQILGRITLSALLHSQAIALQCLLTSQDLSSGQVGAQCPPRLALRTPMHTQLLMPARTTTSDSVIKIVSVPLATSQTRSGVIGTNLVLDDATASVSHVVGSSCLTALRTAAGSLISSILALGDQKHKVHQCLVFGDGAQALFHVWLHLRYFTNLTDVVLVVGNHRHLTLEQLKQKEGTFRNQLRELCQLSPDRIASWQIQCIHAQNRNQLQQALQQSTLVFTCTPSTTPLFAYEYLGDRTRKHICAVGSYTGQMCELPRELVLVASESSCALMVDSIDACCHEAGCLLQAIPDTDQLRQTCVELAKLAPLANSDQNDAQSYLDRLDKLVAQQSHASKHNAHAMLHRSVGVSVFKSVGVALQDVEVTKLVVSLAGDVGTDVSF